MSAAGTIFSKIIAGEIPCQCVYEDERVFAFLDIAPLSHGHVLVLPKEALAHLNVAEGDSLCVTSAADGSLRLSSTDPKVVRQLEVAASVIRRYRNTLRELAK